eukprot:gene42074-13221_t
MGRPGDEHEATQIVQDAAGERGWEPLDDVSWAERGNPVVHTLVNVLTRDYEGSYVSSGRDVAARALVHLCADHPRNLADLRADPAHAAVRGELVEAIARAVGEQAPAL